MIWFNLLFEYNAFIIIVVVVVVVVVVVIGVLGVDAAALLSMMLLFRVEGIGRPGQISLSFFVLSFGIISVKDEDVVACGNFHLVVIRSGGLTSVFAAAAFPSLFRRNCFLLSKPLQPK